MMRSARGLVAALSRSISSLSRWWSRPPFASSSRETASSMAERSSAGISTSSVARALAVALRIMSASLRVSMSSLVETSASACSMLSLSILSTSSSASP